MLIVGVLDEDNVMKPEQLVIEVGRDMHDEAEPTIMECAEEVKDIEDGSEKLVEFCKCFQEKNPATYAKLGIFGKPGPNRQY
nr:odorant-binding protein 10 [Gregopimpla kuwanae]